MNGRPHLRAGVARLYLPRKEDRSRLILVEDCMELDRVNIDSCVGNSDESLLSCYSNTK